MSEIIDFAIAKDNLKKNTTMRLVCRKCTLLISQSLVFICISTVVKINSYERNLTSNYT